MVLSQLTNGEEAVIIKVKGHGAFRRRILEMGFVKGKKVKVIKNAPLKDPIEYQILNYKVSLRRSEAELIEVITMEEAIKMSGHEYHGTQDDTIIESAVKKRGKDIHIALVGNPNSGKTTLFNSASNSYEHVGNYGGVTVDVKTTTFEHNGYTFHISDLPGTYSLSAYSPEEIFVREHIAKNKPDIVINVVDASNLERNLYLTTQLIHMDVKVIIALNMFDELQQRGDHLDYKLLGKMMGMPVVPTVSSKNKGIKKLFDKAIDVFEDKSKTSRRVKINFGEAIEKSVEKIEAQILQHNELHVEMSARFLAIKLLENDKSYNKYLKKEKYKNITEEVKKQKLRLEEYHHENAETVITDARYGFIAGALKDTFKENPIKRRRKTDAIDSVITHRLFGFPIFFIFMWLMFQATFALGEYPMDWIEAGVGALSEWLHGVMPEGSFKDMLIDGVVGGVGEVIVFLPNILILFFFISFMEDTGYMARAAFIMDKVMNKIGLHGKSFIPLIMGFGCNVPAIMATRTIEDRNSRLLTMLINPFMSCSARLPVYILFIAAFFPEYPGTMLFILYATGIALAVLVAKIFNKFVLIKKNVPFVMELPPYRMPTLKSTTRHMWNKGQQYVRKMGGIILIASIIIWFLGYFPRESSNQKLYKTEIEQISAQYNSKIENSEDNASKAALIEQKEDEVSILKNRIHTEQQEESYIGRLGKGVEPIMKPLGFDWKMGVSLISGIAAKEIVISTMSVLYQSGGKEPDDTESLIQNIKNDTYEDGSPVFTPVVALAFLMFTLIYFPCIAVIAAIKKESGAWRWAIYTVLYTTGLAWLVSFGVYQIGSLLF
ncbi:ferrous iron transport protein B [Marinilabiliaceae bacterium ANBcel2]|nr:ferrous iron transport protein B [Marinilabiliaceae bacterium ANBcel2]